MMKNIKCVLVGDIGVGKSTYVSKLINGNFKTEYTPTLYGYCIKYKYIFIYLYFSFFLVCKKVLKLTLKDVSICHI